MRVFDFLFSVAAFTSYCQAQDHTGNGTALPDLSQLPKCGLICLATTAPQSGCGLTDFKCICNNQKMIDLTTRCALSNCTVENAFKLARIQADTCNYSHESRTEEVKQLVVTFATVTKIIIPLRLALRLFTQGSFGWDDWLIVAALCSDTTAFYAALRVLESGLGKHIWDVDPSRIPDFLVWFYVVLVAYILTNGLIKLSVLAFYLRIFTVSDRFKLMCWVNIVFCAALMGAFFLVSIFQCVPISNAFKIMPSDGWCLNYNAATWSHSAVNVFQDILVIILPVMEVVALQMSLRKKIGVIMIFVLGGFVVVASIVRMFAIPGFGRTSDPTWTNTSTFIWSAIELGVGQTCASIPAIYSGLRHIWPGFRKFTTQHISQRSTKPSQESRNHTKQHDNSSSKAQRAKYQRSSSDLPLTSRSNEAYTNDDVELTLSDKGNYGAKSVVTSKFDRPMSPSTKGEIGMSTTITVISGPRSPTVEERRFA